MVGRDQIRAVELFRDLDEGRLTALAEASSEQKLARGDVLFEEHDESTTLYVVQTGRIAMINRSIDGRESVVKLMEPGELFGEMPLFDGQSRSTDARALETSEIVAIPYGPLRQMYDDDPAQLWRVVELFSVRLRVMDGVLADSVFLDVTGRTAKRLLEIAGDADDFSLPVTQEELAGMVGASRERVNKAIASFVKLGWIEQRDRRYHILNRAQLELRSR
ncbi:MAG: Crp/Fnr family transcriptional regulator [Actinomycetia bacterium]|nr:Crp/Fnr family transcriptional regulator [Actinomycetes bacterium]MCP5030865.1 Crp/Fnr family transcriptional regulator [Actinomycetes bacterium]